jgi:hypothetical protein
MPLGLEEVALPFRHGPQELSGLSPVNLENNLDVL